MPNRPAPQWDNTIEFTDAQQDVIDALYHWATVADLGKSVRDLYIRIAYRETRFGEALIGDDGHSVGVFQWYDQGVWLVTPGFKLAGMDGRYNRDLDLANAAWCFKHGYSSHWSLDQRVRWLASIPAPRNK